MFFDKLLGKVKNKTKTIPPQTDTEAGLPTEPQTELQTGPQIEPQAEPQLKSQSQPKPEETKPAAKPPVRSLSRYVTFGRNGNGETAEVVLNDPEHNYHKVLVNYDGFFADFPGIVQGGWTRYLVGKFDFDEGRICFRTSFERQGDGYRCLWEIQPDGRYWADADRFGAENDSEIILYADLDAKGVFKEPFRIYTINGKRVDESDEKADRPGNRHTLEYLVSDALSRLFVLLNEKMPDTGNFNPICFCFDVPDSCYQAYIAIENSKLYENKRSMKVFVAKKYDDMAANHYYSHLTSDEMKAYIQSEEAAADVVSSIKELIKRTDRS